MDHMDEKVTKKRSEIDKFNGNKHLQMNEENDIGHSFELEPNRKKKKEKCKERRKKHKILEKHSTGKAVPNEGDITLMRSGEEISKIKRKKRKRERDNDEIINCNIADDREMLFLDDKQERDTRKRKSYDDSFTGMQEIAALELSNKSKRTENSGWKSIEGDPPSTGIETEDANVDVVVSEVDGQLEKMKIKKKRKKSKRIEDTESKSDEGDPTLTTIKTGDANTLVAEVDDQGKKTKMKNNLSEKSKRTKDIGLKSSEGDSPLTKLGDGNTYYAVAKVDDRGKKMKKTKKNSDTSPEGTSKRVTFSDQVEVFNDGLVLGKRFTPEEDEKIKEAVFNYIESHGLGEEGLDMVLHCRSHPEVRNCWKEIGEILPQRPYQSIYYRAHILFERDEKRKWTPEEYELVKKFQEKLGSNWKILAEAMGKHRLHVKDAWRRVKLPNMNKGQWSQEEYQTLFDLVSKDLRVRATEEFRKSKHGMLRDNICWEAIGDKLTTRTSARCCKKWYDQLTSPMVAEGIWADADDCRLLNSLFSLDACCIQEVDWDNLLEHRSGEVCRKRWNQMIHHIGEHGNKLFAEQVEILSKRYCPELLEAREAYDSKPVIP